MAVQGTDELAISRMGIVGKTTAQEIADLGSGGGGSIADTYETISQNLEANPSTINYTGDNISSIVYDLGAEQSITKTINYTGENITSVVLSGNTPQGINLTKTLNYTGENLTSITYS